MHYTTGTGFCLCLRQRLKYKYVSLDQHLQPARKCYKFCSQAPQRHFRLALPSPHLAECCFTWKDDAVNLCITSGFGRTNAFKPLKMKKTVVRLRIIYDDDSGMMVKPSSISSLTYRTATSGRPESDLRESYKPFALICFQGLAFYSHQPSTKLYKHIGACHWHTQL